MNHFYANPSLFFQAGLAIALLLIIGSLFYVAYHVAIKPDLKEWREERRFEAKLRRMRSAAV